MSQIDSFCAEKTCLSRMYNTSVCAQHMLGNQLDAHKVSCFDSCYSKLTFYF